MSENDIKNIFVISNKCEELEIINDNTPHPWLPVVFIFISRKKLNIYKIKYQSLKISEVTINKCYKKLESNEITKLE